MAAMKTGSQEHMRFSGCVRGRTRYAADGGTAKRIGTCAAAALSLCVIWMPAPLAPSAAWAQSHESGASHDEGTHVGGGRGGGGHGGGHLSGGRGGHRYGSGRSGARHSGGTHIDHLHADSGAVGGADLEDNVFRRGGGYQAFAMRGRDAAGSEAPDGGHEDGHEDEHTDGESQSHE